MADSNLYVVTLTFFNLRNLEQSLIVTVPATCTNLKAAKKEAKVVLAREGYDIRYFSVYNVDDGYNEWKYGDGVIVHAEGPGGEVFDVAIDNIPNTHGLRAGHSGRVKQLPYHILQTIIE
jgi:hypothetical protein